MLKNYYKLLQITVNRPFKTLPRSSLYFSPRSYHQITVNIQLGAGQLLYLACAPVLVEQSCVAACVYALYSLMY